MLFSSSFAVLGTEKSSLFLNGALILVGVTSGVAFGVASGVS